jgi:hypothetical protein
MKIFLPLAALLALACVESTHVAKNVTADMDCKDICDKYQACYDRALNTDRCQLDCKESVHANGELRRKADACDECLNKEACVSAASSCGATCQQVVPMPNEGRPTTSSR